MMRNNYKVDCHDYAKQNLVMTAFLDCYALGRVLAMTGESTLLGGLRFKDEGTLLFAKAKTKNFE